MFEVRPHGFMKSVTRESEQAPVEALRYGRFDTLRRFSRNYVVFSPALLYLYACPDDADPLADFMSETGRSSVVKILQLDIPFFSGLEKDGVSDWNHQLWFFEKADWPHYINWMGSIGFLDRSSGSLMRVSEQKVTMPDVLALRDSAVLPSTLPLLSVSVLSLDSKDGCLFFYQPPTKGVPILPRAYRSRLPLQTTLAMTSAFLSDADDPLGLAEQLFEERTGLSVVENELTYRIRRRQLFEQEKESADDNAS